MNLISVIVPIYNVENYLAKCLDSIVNQTYTNLEIILINDGSTDNSQKIANEYALQDLRIKLINKENGGLSDARNGGLEIFKGDYIVFVDSDDWIAGDMLKHLFDEMVNTQSEIVECAVFYVYGDRNVSNSKTSYKAEYTREDALKELINGGVFQTHVWNKLYKKEVIADIKFPKGKINEDEFWTHQVFANAKKIAYFPKPMYHYLQRENSIMGTYSLRKLNGVEGMFERMLFMKKNFPNLYLDSKIVVFRACLNHYQQILQLKIDEDHVGKNKLIGFRKKLSFSIPEIKKIKNKELLFIMLSSVSLDYTCRLKNILLKNS